MAAHVPTMLAMIIASSLMMAASMAVVGWGRRRDGLGRWAAALLVNAIGHLLIAQARGSSLARARTGCWPLRPS